MTPEDCVSRLRYEKKKKKKHQRHQVDGQRTRKTFARFSRSAPKKKTYEGKFCDLTVHFTFSPTQSAFSEAGKPLLCNRPLIVATKRIIQSNMWR